MARQSSNIWPWVPWRWEILYSVCHVEPRTQHSTKENKKENLLALCFCIHKFPGLKDCIWKPSLRKPVKIRWPQGAFTVQSSQQCYEIPLKMGGEEMRFRDNIQHIQSHIANKSSRAISQILALLIQFSEFFCSCPVPFGSH